jgi:1-acyl-sn-glycerol-3-phosphate acyltransferase
MILYRLAAVLVRPLVWLVFHPTVEGRALVPSRGGFVVAANHLSGFDAFALTYVFRGRVLRSMGKNELFVRPRLGPLVRSLGAFPAHEVDGVGGIATAIEVARAGDGVVIFPTGARLRLDREQRPHSGAARTALGAGVPLVPVGLRGTDGWRQRVRWHIAIGEPIPLDDLASGEPGAAREATRRLWAAITALEETLDTGLAGG